MCGIFGVLGHEDAARLTYMGLYGLQHRGEESAGIFAYNGKKVAYHKGMGLVSEVFGEKTIKSLRGNMALGHVRYSTTGSSHSSNVSKLILSPLGLDSDFLGHTLHSPNLSKPFWMREIYPPNHHHID